MFPADKSVLKIKVDNLKKNYQILCDAAETSKVAPVLKFDAYGLGSIGIAENLVAAGATDFYVFNYVEANVLSVVEGVERIFLFDGVGEESAAEVHRKGFVPVLNTKRQLDIWSKFPRALYSLMIDTGMNRTGLNFEEGCEFLRTNKMHAPEYVLSHLACAEIKDSEFNLHQLKQMQKIRKEFPEQKLSFCNSAGIFLGEEYHFDQVRPGIALYGGHQANYNGQIKNTIYLDASVNVIRTIDSLNKCTGYFSTYEAKPGDKIATLQIGYADGFSRKLSNNAKVCYKGHFLPVVGIVSMDYITVDVTSLNEEELSTLKYVEIIGDNITVDEMAAHTDASSYEIVSGFVGGRFKRVYE